VIFFLRGAGTGTGTAVDIYVDLVSDIVWGVGFNPFGVGHIDQALG